MDSRPLLGVILALALGICRSLPAQESNATQPLPSTAADRATSEMASDSSSSIPRSSRSSARSSYARLSRTPNMFGDSFGSSGQLVENNTNIVGPVEGNNPGPFRIGTGDAVDLPGIGGGVLKVAENNKPLPMDRIFFLYNGFQNALSVGQPLANDVDAHRYTVGLESTFHDRQWSVMVALPLNDDLLLQSSAYTVNTNSMGNLAIYWKHLTYEDDEFAISSGVGFSLPTGSDLHIQNRAFNPVTGFTNVHNLVVRNQSLHLIPFIGLMSQPDDRTFSQMFLSLDLAANGNRVEVGSPPGLAGVWTPQNLLHVNASMGHWLATNPDARYLHGLAAVAEFHYTKTIQDTDTVTVLSNPFTGPLVNARFTNLANQTDIVNVTGGLHLQLGELSNLRVGYVVPLNERPDREFDSEIQVQFNRNY